MSEVPAGPLHRDSPLLGYVPAANRTTMHPQRAQIEIPSSRPPGFLAAGTLSSCCDPVAHSLLTERCRFLRLIRRDSKAARIGRPVSCARASGPSARLLEAASHSLAVAAANPT